MADSTTAAVLLAGVIAGYLLVSWLYDRLFGGQPAPASHRRESPPEPSRPAASSAMAEPARWFEILQVSPDATADEIKQAYRRLIQQYHPDKVASLGVELRDLAAVRSREITAAYQEGLAVRSPGSPV